MNCPHCDMNIDEHKASLCLDAWVAEEVMGWEPVAEPLRGGHYLDRGHIRPLYLSSYVEFMPSRYISSAWEVVEKIGENAFTKVTWYNYDGRQSRWRFTHRGLNITAIAPTAPLAICRAAIKCCSE